MTALEFLTRFPDIVAIGTGGNCTALNLTLSDTVYVLITRVDEPRKPQEADTFASFGVMNDGESVEPRVMSFADAVHWLSGVRDCFDAINHWV